MKKIIAWIKTHPKLAAFMVFAVGAIIVFANRKSGSNEVSYSGSVGYDSQNVTQLAAIQAQADTQQAAARAAVDVANANANAAVEANKDNTAAAIKVTELQTQAAVQIATNQPIVVGKNGVITYDATTPLQAAVRREGYAGPFGDGGAYNYLLQKRGAVQGVRDWYTQHGFTPNF